tara:strand:- start:47 stop:445 length:399 start_codon:yes stop_codon:yes gene_type:complete
MKILKKGTKLYSILYNKCPRCNDGDVFTSNNPYDLSKMFSMHETCSHCGLRYEIEPAFFYGAMYVSYGYTVAVAVATFIIMNIIYSPGIWDVVIALAIILLFGSPYILRISRITYLNIFVKYNPDKQGAKLK